MCIRVSPRQAMNVKSVQIQSCVTLFRFHGAVVSDALLFFPGGKTVLGNAARPKKKQNEQRVRSIIHELILRHVQCTGTSQSGNLCRRWLCTRNWRLLVLLMHQFVWHTVHYLPNELKRDVVKEKYMFLVLYDIVLKPKNRLYSNIHITTQQQKNTNILSLNYFYSE